MKFSLSYVKQNPVMFGAIIVVFGLLFWLLMNRGGSTASAATMVASGPSEGLQAAQLSAGVALQSKQIDAAVANQQGQMQLEALSAQIEGQQNLAVLSMQQHTQDLAAQQEVSDRTTEASLAALQSQLDNNLAVTANNNQFMLDYAGQATEAATQTVAINAALQRDLASQQLDAFEYSTSVNAAANKTNSLLALVSGMKHKRDGLAEIAPYLSGGGAAIQPAPSTSFH